MTAKIMKVDSTMIILLLFWLAALLCCFYSTPQPPKLSGLCLPEPLQCGLLLRFIIIFFLECVDKGAMK